MSLLTSPKIICQRYQIKPLRRRGQNFLINDSVIKKILQTADLNKKDNVLEIGAGSGSLTKEISKKVKKVIAVEIDKKLIEVLKQELKDFKNIKVVQDDIRNIKLSDYGLKNYKLVANLPFNITGLILKQFLTDTVKPELIVLILQREVGERIISQPPRMSKLSVMVQFYGQAKIVSNIKKDNFWPKPNVDSVILKIKPFVSPLFKNEDIFFQIIRAGFSSPRKFLLNNLVKSAIIPKGESNKKIRFSCLRSLKEFQAPLIIPKGESNKKIRFSCLRSLKEFQAPLIIPKGEPNKKIGFSCLRSLEEFQAPLIINKETLIKIFKQMGLSLKIRAQELSVEDWIKLAETLEH